MYSLKNFLLLLFLITSTFGANWFHDDSVAIEEDEVYLSFRYQGVVDGIIVALYDGEKFYLPLTELFDLFAINYELNPARFSISGYYIKEDDTYSLDFSRRKSRFRDDIRELDASDFRVKEIDFYVTPKLLKEAFDLDFRVDLSRLTLEMQTRKILPIVARYNSRYKEELRQKYSQQGSDEYYDLLSARNGRALDGAILDYNWTNRVSEFTRSSDLNLRFGGELLYGDLQGTILTNVNHSGSSVRASDVKWRYVNESKPWFSSATVGQQSTIGLLNRTFNGINVSNDPLVSRRSYDSYALDGATEPEAEIELYQDGRLVQVTTADDVGYYRFLVPLNYGTSNFQIRIYARQGRVIELDRRIQVPFYFLPQGEIRYGVMAGRMGTAGEAWSDQEQLANANVAMGVNNWLTAGLGMEYVQSNEDRPILYSRVSSRVIGDILLNIDAALGNFTRLTMKGIGPNASSFSGEYTNYNKLNIYNSQGLRHQLNSNIFYPFRIGQIRLTGSGRLNWNNRPGKNSVLLSANLNQYFQNFRFRYGITEDHSFGENGHVAASNLELGAVYSLPRIPSINKWLRGTYYRLDLSYNSGLGGMNYAQFQFIKNYNQNLKFQSYLNHDFATKSLSVELSVSWDFNAIRSNTTLRNVSGSPSLNQTIRGSTVLDRNTGQFVWDNRQQVGRSGVKVRMYVDDNNSGAFEEGEEIIPGNALTIERASSRQMVKNDVFYLTQLQAYRRYNFKVNEARINNPILVPLKKEFSVVTDPNRYKELDVPFTRTGIIDGRVDRYKGGELVPIAGLRIHVKADIGDYETTIRTFADGSFYSMELPPGDYTCWVDEAQLEFLGATSTPEQILFTLEAIPEGDFVEGLNFLLR